MKCEYCNKKAKFALFELHPNGAKRWVHVCDKHDRLIAQQNRQLQRDNPNQIWVEGEVKWKTKYLSLEE